MKKIIIFISLFFIGINYIYAKEIVEFSNCVDGDTIKVLLDGTQYTARLLAIDTPESVHTQKKVEYYGKEASEYTCNKIKNAKKIEIEYDDNSDQKDRYNRLLVWVFTDGSLLQKDLVENGYAKVAYLYDDYKYVSELENVQELASAKNIGIWNEEAKTKYNNDNSITNDITDDEIDTKEKDTSKTSNTTDYSTKDIIIIGILILIIVFVGDKTIKKKAKNKLKKYLK